MDLLVTATHWKNFLHLRDHDDAEPHIRDLAILVGKALELADYQTLEVGEWHLPYITDDDWEAAVDCLSRGQGKNFVADRGDCITVLRKVSAARCARISYRPFDGNSSFDAEMDRYELLVGNDAVHASPLEHQCTPDHLIWTRGENEYANPKLHGPLTGFIQFRKTVPNEAVHD